MGCSRVPEDLSDLRGLPRSFVVGVTADAPFELPSDELNKIRRVLRLGTGDRIAVLPNDGSLLVCRLVGRQAVPIQIVQPGTEAAMRLRVAQALPKGDKLDEIIRACTEIGVAEFLLFPSDRSVVRWDGEKFAARVRRLEAIAREACEVSFRTRLPIFSTAESLTSVLGSYSDSVVLSEVEGITHRWVPVGQEPTIVVGPEGGWSARELALIGGRGVTLGPRVLRVDHAAAAAAAILLLGPPGSSKPGASP